MFFDSLVQICTALTKNAPGSIKPITFAEVAPMNPKTTLIPGINRAAKQVIIKSNVIRINWINRGILRISSVSFSSTIYFDWFSSKKGSF